MRSQLPGAVWRAIATDFIVVSPRIGCRRGDAAYESLAESRPRPYITETLQRRGSYERRPALGGNSLVTLLGAFRNSGRKLMLKFDHTKFFDSYKSAFGSVSQSKVDGIESLLTALEADTDVDDERWAAYMFATVKHE